jgi:hypothetical protein
MFVPGGFTRSPRLRGERTHPHLEMKLTQKLRRVKLTLEINSLTLRLNFWRNADLRLNLNRLSPLHF